MARAHCSSRHAAALPHGAGEEGSRAGLEEALFEFLLAGPDRVPPQMIRHDLDCPRVVDGHGVLAFPHIIDGVEIKLAEAAVKELDGADLDHRLHKRVGVEDVPRLANFAGVFFDVAVTFTVVRAIVIWITIWSF